jgi:FkbM family methyltransferase
MKRYWNIYKKYGFDGLKLNFHVKFSKSKIIETKVKGLRSKIKLRNKTSDIEVFKQIFRNREYDIDYISIINPRFIVDCGANTGLSSIYFHLHFPMSTIIAIEPEKENFDTLISNTSSIHNIIPLNKGVWNRKSNLNLIDMNLGAWGYVTEESSSVNNDTIETITITELMKNYNIETIDILKIDIEGSEYNLFMDNFDFWLSKVKVLIIEVHDNLKPGSSMNFLKAICNYKFHYSHKGENIFITFYK